VTGQPTGETLLWRLAMAAWSTVAVAAGSALIWLIWKLGR
jgi:hypothetical protein